MQEMHRNASNRSGAVMWWAVAASNARRAIQDRWRAPFRDALNRRKAASADGDPTARNGFIGSEQLVAA